MKTYAVTIGNGRSKCRIVVKDKDKRTVLQRLRAGHGDNFKVVSLSDKPNT